MRNPDNLAKIDKYVTASVMILGVVAGFVILQQGINFQPRAQTSGRNLPMYGWNGMCFSKLTEVKYASLNQCAGKITNYPKGCQGSVGKRLFAWSFKSATFPLVSNGKSNVCILFRGSPSPKDTDGCYTQQLNVDDGGGGMPEGYYTYDSCSSKLSPTNPKPTTGPTPYSKH